MPDTQHGTWACLPLMWTWAAMWGHGRDDFCGGNNWVLRGFRGVYTELSEPWIFQCCFVAGPVVVLRIFQGWMQQASLAQEHNYPSSETAPLSARGVQRELLGFTGAGSALGAVGFCGCLSAGRMTSPSNLGPAGCSWVFIPASQEWLACSTSAA